jgi:ribosomal protein S18 acetylase RimI-like enzyme
MIVYTDSTDKPRPDQLRGFFAGWPDPPSPQTHLDLLRASDHAILAIDDTTGHVVGFITAITDRLMFAYIPLLEVLPGHRGQGIGHELTRRMIEKLKGLYSIDLICDPELKPFYEKLGMKACVGMTLKDYRRQSGIGRHK